MSESIKLRVLCHSGYRASEEPRGFILGEKKLDVTAVVDRWYGPDRAYYKITADDGNTYIIAYDEKNDEWDLEFFQKK